MQREALEALATHAIGEAKPGVEYPITVWLWVLECLNEKCDADVQKLSKMTTHVRELVAIRSGVSISFVRKVQQSFLASQDGGPLFGTPPPRATTGRKRKITEDVKDAVICRLEMQRTLTAGQLSETLQAEGIADISKTSVTRILKERNMSRKKTHRVSRNKFKQQNLVRAADFRAYMKTVDHSRLRFMDECGVDRSDTGAKTVWSEKGTRVNIMTHGRHGKHYSVYGLTCCRPGEEPLRITMHDGHSNEEVFMDVMQHWVQDGTVRPHDIIVMDNWSGHGNFRDPDSRYNLMREFLLEHMGVQVIRLPVETPEWNPIELMWNLLKQKLKYFEATRDDQVPQAVLQICSMVTTEQIKGGMRKQGYQI
ncbi:Hypothetical protein SCF082_LOCUS49289 [Durusdinium trenchii]|uniref:Tc1-like transposase DDE domain-containing protein n=1 Tax=Durusdinium trenchii TaxID=1381693 RepID=A0ABP0S095_9DINO